MSDETDSSSPSVDEREIQQKELNDALAVWEAVGVELKKLLSEPVPEDFSSGELVLKAEQLLASVRAFGPSNQYGHKTASEAQAERAPVKRYSINIPEKQYYKIGEVSEILDVEPYVLRYWESEFRILKPTRTRARQRLYHQKDLERMHLIKHLIYAEKFTIAGVKKRLRDIDQEEVKKRKAAAAVRKALEKVTNSKVKTAEAASAPDQEDYRKILGEIREMLKEIREKLDS